MEYAPVLANCNYVRFQICKLMIYLLMIFFAYALLVIIYKLLKTKKHFRAVKAICIAEFVLFLSF